MATIDRRNQGGSNKWRVRWTDPEGNRKSKTFDSGTAARKFKTEIEASMDAGSYVDVARGQLLAGDWADRWLASKTRLTASTRSRYEGILDVHIKPRWGNVPLAKIGHADIQVWVADLLDAGQSPASVRKVNGVLSMMLKFAVKDRRIAVNPAEDIDLPEVDEEAEEQRFLIPCQLEDLAEGCGEIFRPYRTLVLFLGYTGLRWGEMAALSAEKLNLLKRRAVIDRSVTPVNGKGLVYGPPKGKKRREVPIPRFLVPDLEAQIANARRGDPVFVGPRGAVMRVRVFTRAALDEVVERVLPDLPGFHPHELRHTAASMAIASGADVKVVQNMLGHKDATMTLNRYGHLMGTRVDEVADAMDAARTRALAARQVAS